MRTNYVGTAQSIAVGDRAASAARAQVACGPRAVDGWAGPYATQVGFADQSHLNRWFRRSFGITPGAYRKAGLALPKNQQAYFREARKRCMRDSDVCATSHVPQRARGQGPVGTGP
jgi:hypothetical protein